MDTTTKRAGLVVLLLTLTMGPGGGASALAAPMALFTETTGTVGDGPGPFFFSGAVSDLFAPGVLDLGTFHSSSLPGTVSLTFNHTPFHLQGSAGPLSPSGTIATGGYSVDGTLDGSLNGKSASTLLLTIDSVEQTWGALPFSIESLRNGLTTSPFAIAPSAFNNGVTELAALVVPNSAVPSPVPEPTSILVALMAVGGYGLRARKRARLVA